MTDYIANSKNRKLKKRIMLFLSRIDFGREKLPLAGKGILFLNGILFLSLFFSWFQFTYMDNSITNYSAFSFYTVYIGYALLIAIFAVPFFLLSHTKKEMIRAYIPFRLSDTQAIVFIISMIFTALMHLLFMSRTFHQFTTDVQIGNGFTLALTSVICIVISAYFLSRQTKL